MEEIKTKEESKQIVITEDMIEKAKRYSKEFNEAKKRLLPESAILKLQTKAGEREYIKKEGWQQLKVLFSISVQELKSERIVDNNKIVWKTTLRASLPNGTFQEVSAIASTDELAKQGKPEYVVQAHSYTRAFNKAISLLVGGAELSAEEIEGVEEDIKNNIPYVNEDDGKNKEKESEKTISNISRSAMVRDLIEFVRDECKYKNKDEVYEKIRRESKVWNLRLFKDCTDEEIRRIYSVFKEDIDALKKEKERERKEKEKESFIDDEIIY